MTTNVQEIHSSGKLSYNNIIPTHDELRSIDSFNYWVNRYSTQTGYIKEHPIILNITEDDLMYLHDGHHRLCAAYSINYPIQKLPFKITNYTYSDMLDINFKCGWVTPFNPNAEVRIHTLDVFKPFIMGLYKIDEKLAVKAIKNNFNIYAKKRTHSHIKEIMNSFYE